MEENKIKQILVQTLNEHIEQLTMHDIICPHGYNVNKTKVFGIDIFFHKHDKKSCDMLNGFFVSSHDIAKTMLSRFNEISLNKTFCILVRHNSPTVLGTISNILSRITDDRDMARQLSELMYIINTSDKKDDMLSSLVNVFGDIFIYNVKIVCGIDLSPYNKNIVIMTSMKMKRISREFSLEIAERIKLANSISLSASSSGSINPLKQKLSDVLHGLK